MKKIKFTKMVASGNDFIIVDQLSGLPVNQLKTLAKKMCDRKYGIGADGLLLLAKSKVGAVKMRIFNADGSEAEMCGNGARCVALYLSGSQEFRKPGVTIETKAGIIQAGVSKNNIKTKLTNPKDIRLDIPIKINNRALKVNFINTGVPHTVIFVAGLGRIDVRSLGAILRYHKRFMPAGTNVDFIEVLNNKSIKIRTYERGVEGETLACGTGAVAAAIIVTGKLANWQTGKQKINVYTQSGEVLKVYFDIVDRKVNNVWLEGRAEIVYKGEYNV